MMARQQRRRRAASYVPSDSSDENEDEISFQQTKKKREDDDDVVVLNSPPPHMRRVSNEDNPIVLDDSDDEDYGTHDLEDDEGYETYDSEDEKYFPPVPWDPHPTRKGKRKTAKAGTAAAEPASSRPGAAKKRKRQDNGKGPSRSNNTRDPQDIRLMSHFRLEPDPGPGPSRPTPTVDDYVAQVIEILPDICPEYARREVMTAAAPAETGVQRVITQALEEQGGYPKAKPVASGSGSRQPEELEDPAGYLSKAYRKEHRKGRQYAINCVAALEAEFPEIPLGHMRLVLADQSSLFAPTYIELRKQQRNTTKRYAPLKKGRRPGKDTTKQPRGVAFADDLCTEGMKEAQRPTSAGDFDREFAWTMQNSARIIEEQDTEEALKLAEEAELEAGHGMECGCCFADYLARNMYQCEDGHLFCKDCTVKHAETKLGDQEYVILCMDTSGCQARYSEKELSKILPAKSLELYHRLRVAKELELAAIEGLESCPYCPWAVVIENPDEKLFRCQNHTCLQTSCRGCKRAEHLPKTCQEAEAERKSNKRHAVEDAMSDALIRKCPKCAKPYVKDHGCNKIYCTNCRTLSCYICQKAVADYSHFEERSYPNPDPKAKKKCVLWDRDEALHDNENIVAARDAAIQAQRDAAAQEGMELEEGDLQVEAPARPAQVAIPYGNMYGIPHYRGAAAGGNADAIGNVWMDQVEARIAELRRRADNDPVPLYRDNQRIARLMDLARQADRLAEGLDKDRRPQNIARRNEHGAPVAPVPGAAAAPLPRVRAVDPARVQPPPAPRPARVYGQGRPLGMPHDPPPNPRENQHEMRRDLRRRLDDRRRRRDELREVREAARVNDDHDFVPMPVGPPPPYVPIQGVDRWRDDVSAHAPPPLDYPPMPVALRQRGRAVRFAPPAAEQRPV